MKIREYMAANQFRYHDNWAQISRQTRKRTRDICCWCWKEKSALTHHAAYINSQGELVGWDDIGILLFGLCQNCHLAIAHSPSNWIVSRFGAMANRNSDEFLEQIRLRFLALKYSPKS